MKMPYTVTNSYKRGMRRTYSRPLQRALDTETAALLRKGFLEQRERLCEHEHNAEPLLQGRLHGNSGFDPSSSQANSDVFSSPTPEEQHDTPPTSPPPCPASPINEPAKSIFSNNLNLKRKRSLGTALKEVNGNSSKKLDRPRKKKQRFTQTQLDLGGQTQTTCKTCGMEYVPSNAEDVALHKKFHSSNTGGVEVGKTFVKETISRRIYISRNQKASDVDAEGYIVVIDQTCPILVKHKAKTVLDVVNAELSAVDVDEDKLWSNIRTTKPSSKLSESKGKKSKEKGNSEDNTEEQSRFKMFLFIKGMHCVGLCLAESIKEAYRVEEGNSKGKAPSAHTRSKSSSITIGKDVVPAIVGISRIWTTRTCRRQGIADALLDSAREYFVYGMKVPKKLIAFSQPTESGCRLAESWFGVLNEWHVYAGS